MKRAAATKYAWSLCMMLSISLVFASVPVGADTQVGPNTTTEEPPTPWVAAAFSISGLALGLAPIWLHEHIPGDRGALVGVSLFILGPSAGHIYLRDVPRTILGVGLRLAGMAAFITGLSGIDWGCQDDYCNDENGGLIPLGALMVLAGIGYSLIDPPIQAYRARDRHGSRVQIMPAVLSTHDENGVLGMRILGRF